MKRYRLRGRVKLHPLIWVIIAIIPAYLLIRLAALSFSDDFGQAKVNISTLLMTKVCETAMESGSSVVRYSKNKDKQYPLMVSVLSDLFAVENYTKSSESLSVLLQEEEPLSMQAAAEAKSNGTIGFHNITGATLPKEYILTNGAIFSEKEFKEHAMAVGFDTLGDGNELPVDVLNGNVIPENDEKNAGGEGSAAEALQTNGGTVFTLDQLKDVNFLVRNFYIVDPTTRITDSLFNAEDFINSDMTIKQGSDAPQILIYHTHSQEAYSDSRKGVKEDTVVGVGTYLTKILTEDYGYNVIHDTTCYDVVDGKLDRNLAYNYALDGISRILRDNPTIEVVIDLHRDGAVKADAPPRSTYIDGIETAQIMLYNGLSRDQNGPIVGLDNPNLKDNLAFSFKLQLKSLELYPGLFYKNYLKYLRYNLHVRPKSILMELGTDHNSLESAKNAMEPFAKILNSVLKGK